MQTLKRITKYLYALSLILFSICSLSCSGERATTVSVEPGPSFSFTGSGRLASFTVYAPRAAQRVALPDSDVASPVWQIRASKGYFKGSKVEGLRVDYGKTPSGYDVALPNPSQAAPLLASGMVYSFLAETTDAPIAEGYFFMNGKEPIQTTIPDACLMLANGHQTRINCTTKLPYQEPADLEEMVRQNRVLK